MQMLYVDFESYYDKEYSLKKITPYEYILDQRWETIGCGIAVGNKEPIFLVGDEIGEFLKDYPRPYAVVSYNALFDASVLAFRYGIHPDLLVDAMGIVRAVLLHKIWNGRVNLENVSQVLHLPPKSQTIHKVSGMRRADIEAIPELWAEFKEYCLTDVKNCRSILRTLAPQFPRPELWVMNSVLKMCTRPNFFGDLTHLYEHLNMVIGEKDALLNRVGLERADLLSSAKFAEALRTLGVTPPTKPSPADPSKRIYAFAKSDEEFRELEEHENPDVQALVAARMGIRSTLEERRTQRFIGMTEEAIDAFNGAPWMPIALRYAGAHTHRLSGEWKVNMQNLPARKSKKLREALIAPPGYKVLAVDASQIEARLTAWLAGETILLQEFTAGHDVYCWFGSDMFKREITKANKLERFVAKNTVLGLGFQMGPKRFLSQLRSQAADNGIELPPDITLSQCELWVNYYRSKFKNISKYWYVMEGILKQMMRPNAPQSRIGPSYTDGTDLVLPNGLRLYYDNLRESGGRKVFNYGGSVKDVYGGKFLENHVQALDRCHVMEAAKRIDDRLKAIGINYVRVAHQIHDELLYVVPDGLVNTLRVIAKEEMSRPSWWATGLPLDAEVKIGKNYGAME
jgi:DNA polymerase family A